MVQFPWFKKRAWEQAQKKEFEWWHGVSQNGYAEQSPREFISIGQKNWMLKQLRYLDKPVSYWKDKVVVEFGPGPAGVVEYIDARRKFAIEPLYYHYHDSFPHLKNSDVAYIAQPAEEAFQVENDISDLTICFNVLDHVYSPKKVLKNVSRVAKPGCDILFQVNVFKTLKEAESKSGLHAELHPHSFTKQGILGLLEASGMELLKYKISDDTNPEGEHFLLVHLQSPNH